MTVFVAASVVAVSSLGLKIHSKIDVYPIVFSMILCRSATLVAGFLASLDENGPGRRTLTSARMSTLSIMFGDRARRWMNLHQYSWSGSPSAYLQLNRSIGSFGAMLMPLKLEHNL